MMPFTRQHAWFALFVLVVFGLGVGAGLMLSRFLPPGPGFGRPFPGRAPRPSDVVERMTRELGLSAEQQQKLRGVVVAADTRFERLRATSRDQFEALRTQLDTEIEQVLTDDQRARFRALMAERRGGFPGPRRNPLAPPDHPAAPPEGPPPVPPGGDQPPAPPPR